MEHRHDSRLPAGSETPGSRRPWRWKLAVIVLAVAATGAAVLYFSAPEEPGHDVPAFCRQVRRVSELLDAELPGNPPTEDATRVRAAQIVLLSEELARRAPADVRPRVEEAIERFRLVVRSGDPSDLEAAKKSAATPLIGGQGTESCPG